MINEIKCPSCGSAFQMEEAVAKEYKKELRTKMEEFMRTKNDEFRLKEDQWKEKEQSLEAAAKNKEKTLLEQQQLREKQWQEQIVKQEENFRQEAEAEKKKLQQAMEAALTKKIGADFENQLAILKQSNETNEEKLKAARKQQLEFMQKEEELRIKEAELELTVQKTLQEERLRITEEIRKFEDQKAAGRETAFQLKLKELEKQLDDQKKLAEEMRRKAEQGSMQLQGEVQELALEEMLKATFPFDIISEVGKGIKGADCTQTVRNSLGQECGTIVFESKRSKTFNNEWIEKLKSDARNLGADAAVIVTQVLPKEMDSFGEKNGVWICSFNDARAVTTILRDAILKVYNAGKREENKGEKMQMLYTYLTSAEFSGQWKAIREGFMTMKNAIARERDVMEKLWKAREKQIEKVLLNAAYVKGSIEGIAGQDVTMELEFPDEDMPLLD